VHFLQRQCGGSRLLSHLGLGKGSLASDYGGGVFDKGDTVLGGAGHRTMGTHTVL
jgi:hypothetical protein